MSKVAIQGVKGSYHDQVAKEYFDNSVEIIEFLSSLPWWSWVLVLIVIVAFRDVLQPRHTISHNFPVLGHFRFILEKIGPELRQYLVANNREELPFNRIERSWIYASAKKENNYEIAYR